MKMEISKSTEKGLFAVKVQYENGRTSNWTCTIERDENTIILTNIETKKITKIHE